MNTIGEELKVVEMFANKARTTTVGTYFSSVADRAGLESAVLTLQSAKSTAGTGVSLTVTTEESDAVVRGTNNNGTGAESTSNVLRSATDTNIKFAAKVTQSGTRQIDSVSLRIKQLGTITVGKKMTVTLETDSTGDPSGTLVHEDATVDLVVDNVASTFAFVKFTFPRPINIADTTVYHIVLVADYDVSATDNIQWATSTVSSGGDFNIFATSWAGVVATTLAVSFNEEFNFSAVTGGAFTVVDELADSFQNVSLKLEGVKKNVAFKAVVAGASASFICSATTILGKGRALPIT